MTPMFVPLGRSIYIEDGQGPTFNDGNPYNWYIKAMEIVKNATISIKTLG